MSGSAETAAATSAPVAGAWARTSAMPSLAATYNNWVVT